MSEKNPAVISDWDYGDRVGGGDSTASLGATDETSPIAAGTVVFENITLISGQQDAQDTANNYTIDLKEVCTNVTIYEDISNYHLTGRATIVDGLDLVKYQKIVGQETLTIKASIPDENGNIFGKDEDDPYMNTMDHTFRVYAISDYNRVSDTTATYVLHFTDPLAYEFHQTKVNKVLRGKYSDILANALYEDSEMKKYLGQSRSGIEETEPDNMQIVAPNWNINRLIQFCVDNAEPKSNKSWKNSMFFYQTLFRTNEQDNLYKFRSFGQMCKSELLHQETFKFFGNHQLDKSDASTYEERRRNIIDYYRPVKGNTLKGVTSGAYAGKMVTYDPVRKIHEDTTYSISDVFDRGDKESHVLKRPMIRADVEIPLYRLEESLSEGVPQIETMFFDKRPDQGFDDITLYRVNMTNAYSDEEKLIDANDSSKVQQQIGLEYRDTGHLERRALLSILEQNTLRVKLPIRFDMHCGTTVNLNLPSPEVKKGEHTPDELESDIYLIGKITYELSPLNQYGEISLQCSKESFGVDIETYRPSKEEEM